MSFLNVPEHHTILPLWCRMLARAINALLDGKSNNTGTLTLTASSATTVITFPDGKLGEGTIIFLTPTTSNAAGAMASLYVSGRDVANKTLTLAHANTTSTDRVFSYALIG